MTTWVKLSRGLEDRLALWEDTEKGLAFASGMAAISTTLLAYLRPGDVIIHSAPIYGGTEYLIRNILPEYGIKAVEFDWERPAQATRPGQKL